MEDLLHMSNSFPAVGKPSRIESAADCIFVSSYKVDTAADAWTPGDDGLEHMALTVWMYPRHAGPLRLRLLAAYEAPGGSLRSSQLALDVHAVPALSAMPVSVVPVLGTLATWQVEVLLQLHRERITHSSLSAGPFVFSTLAVKSRYWQLVHESVAHAAVAAESVQVQTEEEKRVDAEAGCPAVVRLCPCPAAMPGTTKGQELHSHMNACSLMVPWRHLPSGCGTSTTVGLFIVSSMQLSERLQDSALRMTATVLGAAPGSAHACTIRSAGAETLATVQLRFRNCSTHAMSLCIECGDLCAEQLRSQQAASRTAGEAAAVGVSEQQLQAQCLMVPTFGRHRWLGALRHHIRSLPAQAEEAHAVLLALKGPGAFSVSDFVCTWNVPECGILGRVIQGERLEVFVDS
jgi:hypothetical protein